MKRGKSGISPVMATVILVAIAIVIAIAVAFWATGLVGVFTRYEKLEITSIYYDATAKVVKLTVRNTGSADATIDNIFVSGVPCVTGNEDACEIDPSITDSDNPLLIAVGETKTITITQPPVTGGQWKPGVTYEVAVHTASGKTYPAAVLIP